jgi:enolase
MKIKAISAEKILDSRKEDTVRVFVKTDNGIFSTSSPYGKSTGKYETPAFIRNVNESIKILKDNEDKIVELDIKNFSDLEKIEQIVGKTVIGANTLFALEASVLKALAYSEKKELWELLNDKARRFPTPIGNTIGGGLHTHLNSGKGADFQEFLTIPRLRKFVDNVDVLKKAHEIAGKRLEMKKARHGLNDENAWVSSLDNEGNLSVLNQTREEISRELDEKIEIGVDVAASSFYYGVYHYKNPENLLKNKEQIDYINGLIEKFNLFYVEDPIQQESFQDFAQLRAGLKKPCLVVGDDLTASHTARLAQAIKNRSINAIIVKPNQSGSLLEIKKLIEMAKKYEIACIMSHRSGETLDSTIADLAFGFQCEFIKTRIMGKEGEFKFRRMIEIEKSFE